MFTGLVEDVGRIVSVSPLPRASGVRLRLAAKLLGEAMPLGASLAVDGVCLTVVTSRPETAEVEVEAGPAERAAAVQVDFESQGELKPGKQRPEGDEVVP